MILSFRNAVLPCFRVKYDGAENKFIETTKKYEILINSLKQCSETTK